MYLSVKGGAQHIQTIEFLTDVLHSWKKLGDDICSVNYAWDFAKSNVVGSKALGYFSTGWNVDLIKWSVDFKKEHAEAMSHSTTIKVNENNITTFEHLELSERIKQY